MSPPAILTRALRVPKALQGTPETGSNKAMDAWGGSKDTHEAGALAPETVSRLETLGHVVVERGGSPAMSR